MGETARVATGPAMPDGIDEIILPISTPTNIRFDGAASGRFRVEEITSDMYNISERLKEIDPNLYVLLREDRAMGAKAFTIMWSRETDDELVLTCRRLDARVIEHVQYLMKVPLERRFNEACKIIDKLEAEKAEDEKDELVEKLGLPMIRELQRCGFIDTRGGFQHQPRNFGKK
jgi:hypothetical protein